MLLGEKIYWAAAFRNKTTTDISCSRQVRFLSTVLNHPSFTPLYSSCPSEAMPSEPSQWPLWLRRRSWTVLMRHTYIQKTFRKRRNKLVTVTLSWFSFFLYFYIFIYFSLRKTLGLIDLTGQHFQSKAWSSQQVAENSKNKKWRTGLEWLKLP